MAREQVNLALRYGASPNLKDADGCTPVDIARMKWNEWEKEIEDKADTEKYTRLDIVHNILETVANAMD